jgi:hypothetical protein
MLKIEVKKPLAGVFIAYAAILNIAILGQLCYWTLFFAARMLRKSCRIASVHWSAVGPRPAAELGTLVVHHRLANFGLGVHHKRAILRDRLTNRAGLEQQKFS